MDQYDGRPPEPNPLVMLIIATLWLAFACAMPLHQVSEERRHAHEELLRVVTVDKPDQARIIATFDRSNKDLDAAASGPCLLLAFTIIFLTNHLLKLKRRYNALGRELLVPNRRDVGFHNASED